MTFIALAGLLPVKALNKTKWQARNLTNGWHLDHALLASLVRLWPGPAGDDCHTSIADFGAGGGHYCKFFNKTGECP